jgi:hypothetical protein
LLIAEYNRRSAIFKHWQLALQSEARECLEASMSLWIVTVLDADTGAQKQLFLGDHLEIK